MKPPLALTLLPSLLLASCRARIRISRYRDLGVRAAEFRSEAAAAVASEEEALKCASLCAGDLDGTVRQRQREK